MEQSEAIDKLATGGFVMRRERPCHSCGGSSYTFPLPALIDLIPLGSIWSVIPEAPGYVVSTGGVVASTMKGQARALKGSRGGQGGYTYVGFSGGRKRYVHQLVCETFNGPKPGPDYVVRHLNGDPTDNRASNLAWGTYAENAADTKLHGRALTGEKNHQAVLTSEKVREMRELRARGTSFKSIAERFDVAPMTAHRAINGVTWNV